MADNIELAAASGGSNVKTDDDGVAHWQYVKLAYGADNTQTRVTATNPLPVDIYSGTIDVMLGTDFSAVLGTSNIVATDGSAALTLGLHALGTDGTNAQILSTTTGGHVHIHDGGNSITVDGTVTANLGATDNAVLDSIDAAVNGTLTVGSHAVTNAGTFAVQVDGDALTALQLIDDAIYADDADWTDTTSKHMLVGGLYQSTPQTITDGDVGPLQVDSNGNLIVAVTGTVTVGSHAVTNAGTFAVQVDGDALTALQLIDDAVYTDATGTPSKGIAVMGTDGTNPQLISVDTSGNVQVDIVSSAALDVSAATVTVDLGANNDVQGNVAHDAAVSGNPFTTAGEARSSEGTAVANADVVRLMADLVGKLVNSPYAPSDLWWQSDGSKPDTTDLELAAAAGVGIKNYITDLIITNSSATDTTAILKDGATEIARFPVPANGGVVHSFSVPFKTTANEALNIASAASLSTMYFAASGYTGR